MKNKKPLRLISTDSIGFFGSAKQFLYLYKDYFEDGTFDGVEMIAFKPKNRLKKFISILEKNHIPIISFHGKTGGEDRLPIKYKILMKIVNSFIFGFEELALNFNKREFLFHTPYLENESVKKAVIKNKPKVLWIENHIYGKKGVEEAKKLIEEYQKLKIEVKGMLDLYHLLANLKKEELIKNWSQIIEEIKTYLKWFSGIHLPIGSRKDDSLPIEEMTDEMLSLLGKEVISHIQRIVIENQQKNFGLFYSTKRMINEQKERNRKNFLRLKKAGIL